VYLYILYVFPPFGNHFVSPRGVGAGFLFRTVPNALRQSLNIVVASQRGHIVGNFGGVSEKSIEKSKILLAFLDCLCYY